MKTTKLIFSILLIIFSQNLISQKVVPTSNEQTIAVKLGTVNPVKEYKEILASETEKRAARKKETKPPRNFEGRFPRKIVDPSKQGTGPDPVLQTDYTPKKFRPIETIVNREGLTSGSPPNDPSGDAGNNYYLQAINSTRIGVYQKDGTFVDDFTGNSLWSSVGFRSAGDPIILFDQEAERWIITEFPPGNFLLVAISVTDDPLGDYDVYSFGTPNFPDYPKYSIWNNEYMVTTNEEGPNSLIVYFLNRQDLLDGEDEVRMIRSTIQGPTNSEQFFIVTTPVDWSGNERPPSERGPISLSLADASWTTGQLQDVINVHSYEVDWDASDVVSSISQVPVADYNSFPCADTDGPGFPCVPQPSGHGLDALPEIVGYQPHYRNFGTHESMVFTFPTDVGISPDIRAGIRWVELRRDTTEDWSLYQEGTYAPDDDLHRFMAGISMDEGGNIGMAYVTSSSSEFAGIRFTGRNSSDTPGQMTLGEVIAIEGENTISGRGRFGDYAHMTIDPADNRTFWYTSEYAGDGNAATRILGFRVSKKDYDLSATTINQPVSSTDLTASERVQMTIRNVGNLPIDNYTVGYQIEDQPPVIESIGFRIEPDANFTYDFAQNADLSEIRTYDVKVFSSYVQDDFFINDTTRTTLEKFAKRDLAVTSVSSQPTICGTTFDLSYTVQNLGKQSISSFNVELDLNGTNILNETGQYNLMPGQDTTLMITVDDLLDGNNTVDVRVSNPNGLTEELPNDNSASLTVNALTQTEEVILDILTDFYPEEITWELLDASNNVLFQSQESLVGKREEHIIESLCLVRDSCYTFRIFDAAGDGLTSITRDDGSYEIRDASGSVLASIIRSDYGDEETNYFCFNEECQLQADFEISAPGTTDDGVIIVTVTNGSGPNFSYSIDGVNFQEENIFDNLAEGTYEVIVRDEYGCQLSNAVQLQTSSISELSSGARLVLSPNPTEAVFKIELQGYDSNKVFLPVSIYNTSGEIIRNTKITRFSGVYKGAISLHSYPSGTYLVKVGLGQEIRLAKLVKN